MIEALGAADLLAIRQIIADHTTALTIRTFGAEAIAAQASEVQRLVNAEILDPQAVGEVDPVQDSYLLGLLRRRIEQAGGNPDALTVADLHALLEKNPIPSLRPEQLAVQYAKTWAAQKCVGLGNRIADQVLSAVNVEDATLRAQRMALIQAKTAESLALRVSHRRLATTLRSMTGDWGRDWLRIATTEQQDAHEYGMGDAIGEEHGAQARVAKIPNPDACQHCLRLHLEGGRPRIFALSELEANGTNKGRKAADWLPVVGTVHPWCHCTLVHVPEGMEFDADWNLVPAGG